MAIRTRAVRAGIVVVALIVACTTIEGPCTIDHGVITCREGGRVLLFKSETTLKEAIEAADDKTEAEDQRLQVNPRKRR